jgi:hypothetical protein
MSAGGGGGSGGPLGPAPIVWANLLADKMETKLKQQQLQ